MASERVYYGRVKTVNTTPPSLTIVPEDRSIRPDHDFAFDLSRVQLAGFLLSFAAGEMWVSYVLRPGPVGRLVVQDVRTVGAVTVKQEHGSSGSGRALGEVRVKEEKNVRIG